MKHFLSCIVALFSVLGWLQVLYKWHNLAAKKSHSGNNFKAGCLPAQYLVFVSKQYKRLRLLDYDNIF